MKSSSSFIIHIYHSSISFFITSFITYILYSLIDVQFFFFVFFVDRLGKEVYSRHKGCCSSHRFGRLASSLVNDEESPQIWGEGRRLHFGQKHADPRVKRLFAIRRCVPSFPNYGCPINQSSIPLRRLSHENFGARAHHNQIVILETKGAASNEYIYLLFVL